MGGSEMQNINIKAKDGAVINAVACDIEKPNIKGVVIISHGFGEHSNSYGELAGRLGQADYASVCLDQRGHGKPPDGRKHWQGVIPGYQSFLDDIVSVTDKVGQMAPNVPIALYGHSMGGNIVVNTMLRHDFKYACAVLESPWFGLSNDPGPFIACLAKIIGAITPNATIVSKLKTSDISGDMASAEGYTKDPLYHNRISLRMFSGLKGGCAYVMKNAARLSAPTFLAYAMNERIVCNKAILNFAADAGDIVTVKEYESCHAIHNDVKRDEYFHDMIAFLDAHCSS
jgi:alpha-beta hydrolase superfamily lysophospholipase